MGLLNVGTEPGKGNELTKDAYPLLQEQRPIRFVGNVEARDVMAGTVMCLYVMDLQGIYC